MPKMIVRRIALKIANLKTVREIRYADQTVLRPKVAPPEISESEPWMRETLGFLLKFSEGGLLDIGVNLGQTLTTYKLLAPEAPYIGVEPNPDCVSYARQLVHDNGFTDVTIIPAAIGDHPGLVKLDFYQDTKSDSSASIIPGFRPDRPVFRSEFVASIIGTDLADAIKDTAIGIVKIDVEGAEAIVLGQLSDMLETVRPFVTVEILPAYSDQNTARLESQAIIEALVHKLDYKIFRILHDANTLHGFEEIESFGIYSDIALSDYVLSPNEHKDLFYSGK